MNIAKICLAVALCVFGGFAADSNSSPRPKGKLFEDDSFFPIAVWLQSPGNAERFKAAGINLYVGLWRGPTGEQLAALEKAGCR